MDRPQLINNMIKDILIKDREQQLKRFTNTKTLIHILHQIQIESTLLFELVLNLQTIPGKQQKTFMELLEAQERACQIQSIISLQELINRSQAKSQIF